MRLFGEIFYDKDESDHNENITTVVAKAVLSKPYLRRSLKFAKLKEATMAMVRGTRV